MDNKSKSVQNLNDLCQKSYGNSEVFWEIEDQMPCSEIIEQMPNSEIPDTTNTTDIIDDSEKVTRLPTLHIEHDASAIRKLKRLYVRTGLVAIFSVIATIAIAILIFYIWAKVIRFKVPFFYFNSHYWNFRCIQHLSSSIGFIQNKDIF